MVGRSVWRATGFAKWVVRFVVAWARWPIKVRAVSSSLQRASRLLWRDSSLGLRVRSIRCGVLCGCSCAAVRPAAWSASGTLVVILTQWPIGAYCVGRRRASAFATTLMLHLARRPITRSPVAPALAVRLCLFRRGIPPSLVVNAKLKI